MIRLQGLKLPHTQTHLRSLHSSSIRFAQSDGNKEAGPSSLTNNARVSTSASPFRSANNITTPTVSMEAESVRRSLATKRTVSKVSNRRDRIGKKDFVEQS
jgi:hypothetical protein